MVVSTSDWWLMMVNDYLMLMDDEILIWLVVSTYPSEKYDFVSWGYDIPNWMEKNMFQTTNQISEHRFPSHLQLMISGWKNMVKRRCILGVNLVHWSAKMFAQSQKGSTTRATIHPVPQKKSCNSDFNQDSDAWIHWIFTPDSCGIF